MTGVSGAGKSTLVNDILYPALARQFNNSTCREWASTAPYTGLEQLDKVIDIDQRPIGRTPRSNPATYIKVFDEIRRLVRPAPRSAHPRLQAGKRFSFNVKGGRCEACQGDGVRKIEMHFLADVYVKCEECDGRRYNREATLRGGLQSDKSIADVLDHDGRRKAAEFFKAVPRDPQHCSTRWRYSPMSASTTSISANRRPRCRAARRNGSSWLKRTGEAAPPDKTLYILDEPTTGLHYDDVRKLLDGAACRLVEAGQHDDRDRAQSSKSSRPPTGSWISGRGEAPTAVRSSLRGRRSVSPKPRPLIPVDISRSS